MTGPRVIVVGGGPAGAGAAIQLQRHGCQVTILDKATFPRDKCCGDGLTTSALRHLEALGFDPRTLPSWRVVTDSVWRSPSGRVVQLPVPDDGIRIGVARRVELDAGLLNLAKHEGADVQEGVGVIGVSQRGPEMLVTTQTGEDLVSDFVVGADGMWSTVRKLVDPTPDRYKGDIHAFRQYFTNVTGLGRDRLWVSFERDLLPAYMWSFPVGADGANVGFGVQRRKGQSTGFMKDLWPELLARPHVREVLGEAAVADGAHKAWPIPAAIQTKRLTACSGRVLFIGDAARVVDPLTGEGIGQALETGELAASAIAAHGATFPLDVAHQYRKAIRSGMAIDNAFARSLTKIVSYELSARGVIRMAPKGPWRGRYAVKWAFEDNPRAGLLTPWRWRQRFTEKGGAFK